MPEICGQQLSENHWNCILKPSHEGPWHMTLFGQTWSDGDTEITQGFPPVPGEQPAPKARYRVIRDDRIGRWSLTIVRADAELVAVVVNGDQALAERICELLNAEPVEQPLLLLTVEQAAARIGIGRTRMFTLVASGTVKSIALGRSRRIHPDDLAAYVEQLRRGHA